MVSDSDGIGRDGTAPERARQPGWDGGDHSGEDDGSRAGRGYRSPMTVALVAGAVLLAGSGAYWAAAAAGPGADRPADAVPAPLAMAGAQGGGALRVTGSLPAGPGVAPVYGPGGPVPRERVARLAAALRVAGSPVERGGVWKAGPSGGRPGPVLQAAADDPGAWAFSAAGAGTRCQAPTSSGAAPGAGGGPVCFGPVARGGGAVSAAAAEKAAAPVLAALGLGGAAVDAGRTAGGTREVTADPVVGGLPTYGWRTTLAVGPDGRLVSGSGRLVPLARGAEYPVVAAAEAARGDGGGGVALCGGGVMRPGGVPAGGRVNSGVAGSARTNGAGTPSGAPERRNLPCLASQQRLDVTRAVFGLSAQIVSGRAELVPSWLLTVEGAGGPGGAAPGVVARPAVSPAFVAPPPAPGASGAPGAAGAGAPGGVATAPSGGAAGGGAAERPSVTSYAGTGRTLTLSFWGGVCARYGAVATAQDAASVRVRITARASDPGRPCPMIAKRVTATVTLDRPLGGRAVYDASGGARIPARQG